MKSIHTGVVFWELFSRASIGCHYSRSWNFQLKISLCSVFQHAELKFQGCSWVLDNGFALMVIWHLIFAPKWTYQLSGFRHSWISSQFSGLITTITWNTVVYMPLSTIYIPIAICGQLSINYTQQQPIGVYIKPISTTWRLIAHITVS